MGIVCSPINVVKHFFGKKTAGYNTKMAQCSHTTKLKDQSKRQKTQSDEVCVNVYGRDWNGSSISYGTNNRRHNHLEYTSKQTPFIQPPMHILLPRPSIPHPPERKMEDFFFSLSAPVFHSHADSPKDKFVTFKEVLICSLNFNWICGYKLICILVIIQVSIHSVFYSLHLSYANIWLFEDLYYEI